MPKVDDELSKIMTEIVYDIKNLKEDDNDVLVKIGVTLEQTLSIIPADKSGAYTLLQLCLEGLQTIYQNNLHDFEVLVIALTEATEAVIQYIKTEDDESSELILKQAWNKLWDAIELNHNVNGDTEFDAEIKEVESDLSLDDVATQLLQLELNDHSGLSSIMKNLENMANRESIPKSVQQNVSQASKALGEILHGNTTDPDSIYAEVSSLIEAAMVNLEDSVIEESKPEKKDTTSESSIENLQFETLPPDADISLLSDFITESLEYIEGSETA